MHEYESIRTGYRVYGQNISELARVTGQSRNTIKKAIRGEPWGYQERSHQPFPALGDYTVIIDNWLKNDKDKPKKQQHTAHRIYNRLLDEHGFKCRNNTPITRHDASRCGPAGWHFPISCARLYNFNFR